VSRPPPPFSSPHASCFPSDHPTFYSVASTLIHVVPRVFPPVTSPNVPLCRKTELGAVQCSGCSCAVISTNFTSHSNTDVTDPTRYCATLSPDACFTDINQSTPAGHCQRQQLAIYSLLLAWCRHKNVWSSSRVLMTDLPIASRSRDAVYRYPRRGGIYYICYRWPTFTACKRLHYAASGFTSCPHTDES